MAITNMEGAVFFLILAGLLQITSGIPIDLTGRGGSLARTARFNANNVVREKRSLETQARKGYVAQAASFTEQGRGGSLAQAALREKRSLLMLTGVSGFNEQGRGGNRGATQLNANNVVREKRSLKTQARKGYVAQAASFTEQGRGGSLAHAALREKRSLLMLSRGGEGFTGPHRGGNTGATQLNDNNVVREKRSLKTETGVSGFNEQGRGGNRGANRGATQLNANNVVREKRSLKTETGVSGFNEQGRGGNRGATQLNANNVVREKRSLKTESRGGEGFIEQNRGGGLHGATQLNDNNVVREKRSLLCPGGEGFVANGAQSNANNVVREKRSLKTESRGGEGFTEQNKGGNHGATQLNDNNVVREKRSLETFRC